VQKWEIGDKKASGPALKLLALVERDGRVAAIGKLDRTRAED